MSEPAIPPTESPPAPPVRPPSLALRLTLPAAILAALLAVFWPRDDGRGPSRGGFPLDAKGQKVALDARLAPVTLVHFWATWCPPCVTEIPVLTALARDLAAEPDFRVLFVAVEDDSEKVATFLGPELAASALYDPRWDVSHRWGTRQLPETYLVVRGEVIERFIGATDWSDRTVRAKLTQALRPESSTATGG